MLPLCLCIQLVEWCEHPFISVPKLGSPSEKTRYDTSLGLLTKKFVGLLQSATDGVRKMMVVERERERGCFNFDLPVFNYLWSLSFLYEINFVKAPIS